jgi:hypothetical protein
MNNKNEFYTQLFSYFEKVFTVCFHIYDILSNTQILSACLTGYRLGPWRSYRYETGIIRTSMARGCARWTKFSRKVTIGRSTKKGYATYVLYCKSFITHSEKGFLSSIIYETSMISENDSEENNELNLLWTETCLLIEKIWYIRCALNLDFTELTSL